MPGRFILACWEGTIELLLGRFAWIFYLCWTTLLLWLSTHLTPKFGGGGILFWGFDCDDKFVFEVTGGDMFLRGFTGKFTCGFYLGADCTFCDRFCWL